MGVAQGEDNAPPNIPKKKAPNTPLDFLGTLQELLPLFLITPMVCKPTKSIMTPRTRYHHFPAPEKNFPRSADAIPNTTNVNIKPNENTKEYLKARFLSLFAFVPTYPMTRGTVDNKQGLKDEIIPAKKHIIKVIKRFPDIKVVILVI